MNGSKRNLYNIWVREHFIYYHTYMPYKFDKALRVLLLYMEVIGTYSSIYCEIDLSQLLYSFWRVGIIMSKLKNKLCIN